MSAAGPSASPAPSASASASRSASVSAPRERSNGNQAEPSTTPSFAQNLQEYIFNTGFCAQQFADVQVVFFNTSLKLHRLILARSPYLAHLMLSLMPGSTLQLAFTDANITEEAVYIALQHLYNPALAHVNAANARAVLATSYLFGGMPELVEHAYTVTSAALTAANVGEYVRWLGRISPPSGNGTPAAGNGAGNGFAFGTATPIGSGSGASSYAGDEAVGDYGEYSARLRADVLDFLLRTLPAQIGASLEGPSLASDPRLMAAYVPLPFELFKQCVESPELPIPFMQDRFAFAKRAIAARKKAGNQGMPPMEESVVLALKDDGDGMAVHVTRKPRRSRAALWKVEG